MAVRAPGSCFSVGSEIGGVGAAAEPRPGASPASPVRQDAPLPAKAPSGRSPPSSNADIPFPVPNESTSTATPPAGARSRLASEAERGRARLVLGWETTQEDQAL